MSAVLVPQDEAQAADMVRAAGAAGRRLTISGGETRSGFRQTAAADAVLRTTALSGIVAYDPAEMVMTARAGTPVADIDMALAANGQMLSFEPVDHRPVMGTNGQPSIGGVFACNASGPRRLSAGAARDSLLGIRFINGKGEAIRAGGRVMKNVTGLDLVKLLAGSHGTLGLLTEVTFRVLPRPQAQETVVVSGLDDEVATRALAQATALPLDVSGAAHLPESVRSRVLNGTLPEGPATVLRLEGLPASVPARAERLVAALSRHGPVVRLGAEETTALWRDIRDATAYADGTQRPMWRVSVAPSAGAALVANLRMEVGIDAFYDWQGGLIWMRMEADPDADLLRAAIRRFGGGHATLLRAAPHLRQSVSTFEPLSPPVAALTERVRAALDPAGVFDPRSIHV